MNTLTAIRQACAGLAKRARYVKLNNDKIDAYAQSLAQEATIAPSYDLKHHFLGSAEDTLAYILTLDTINFGSGYFPWLQKRHSMSGYFTVASRLKDYFESRGPLSAPELESLSLEDCAGIFAQNLDDVVRAELMALFTQALNELGEYLLREFDGSFVDLIASAQQSAERLLRLLAKMPYFQDVADYDGLEVPLYKRAQITASDLALAFAGQGYGQFDDLEQLTIFADNLLPHVLRLDGLLGYDPALISRIDAGELIPAGSLEEIELRAVTLHAVELLVAALQRAGHKVTAQQLDVLLWNRGQANRYKALARHRTQTVFY